MSTEVFQKKVLLERYEEIKKGFFDNLEGKPRLKNKYHNIDPLDMALLEHMRSRTTFYPLFYTVPAIAFTYIFTHYFDISLLKNPLRKVEPFKIKVSKQVRWVYFGSATMFLVPLIHAHFIVKYAACQLFLHHKYQDLVRKYVVARDDLILNEVVRGMDKRAEIDDGKRGF